MTVLLGGGPVTARSLLLGADDDLAAMGRLLETSTPPPGGSGALGAFGASARRAVHRDVADAAAGLLDLDVTDVLAAGWRRHQELRAAGRRTLAAPGTRETVRLVEHRISHRSQPYVDVVLGEALVTRVTLTLEVRVDITGLEASVRDGRLTAVHAGDAVVTASLAVEGVRLAGPSRRLRLPAELSMGEGIALLGPEPLGAEPTASVTGPPLPRRQRRPGLS